MQTDQTTLNISSTPTVSVAQEWRQSLVEWGRAARAVLPAFLLSRLILLLLTWLGVVATLAVYSPLSLLPSTVFSSWNHWDAARILTVATMGYQLPEMTAYFPLYPALVQLVSKILHLDLLFAGMLITNLAFLATLTVFYRFVLVEFDAEVAKRSALYLAIFPTALFTFAAYATALFLLFLLLCFYALRRAHWWLAGLFGALAALTDAAGILLLIVFISEFVRQRSAALRASDTKQSTLRQWLPLCAAVLIPLGLAIYAFALARQFGQPFAFLRLQDGSSRLNAPWTAVFAALHNLLAGSLYTFAFAHSLFALLLLALFLVLTILSWTGLLRLRADQWPLTLFTLSMFIYTLVLPSMPGPRWSNLDPLPAVQYTLLETFTAFIVLARLGRRAWFHQGYLLLALPLYAFLVLQLLTNHWNL